jgi:hypothetical protein
VSLILKFCLPKGKPVLQLTTILVWFSIKPKFEDCNSDWGAMVQVVTAQKKFEDCNSDWGAMVQVVTAQKSMGGNVQRRLGRGWAWGSTMLSSLARCRLSGSGVAHG